VTEVCCVAPDIKLHKGQYVTYAVTLFTIHTVKGINYAVLSFVSFHDRKTYVKETTHIMLNYFLTIFLKLLNMTLKKLHNSDSVF